MFVPQSRPRAFLIAALEGIPLADLMQESPSLPFHPRAVLKAAKEIDNRGWVWWSLPAPSGNTVQFSDIERRVRPTDLFFVSEI